MTKYFSRLSLLVFILLPVTVFSQAESPYDKFSAKKNFTDKTTVTWEYVSGDINKRCDEESKNVGNNGFSYKLDACSFWIKGASGHTCHIITTEAVDMWTVGHEIRHCFQGEFH